MLNDFYNFLLLFIFAKINSSIKLKGRKYFSLQWNAQILKFVYVLIKFFPNLNQFLWNI